MYIFVYLYLGCLVSSLPPLSLLMSLLHIFVSLYFCYVSKFVFLYFVYLGCLVSSLPPLSLLMRLPNIFVSLFFFCKFLLYISLCICVALFHHCPLSHCWWACLTRPMMVLRLSAPHALPSVPKICPIRGRQIEVPLLMEWGRMAKKTCPFANGPNISFKERVHKTTFRIYVIFLQKK